VGTYLVSNNLSSNAHGNGYADPNIMVPAILAGVQTDGGAFNVREGNHAENLSAIYQLRSRLEPFVTVTGDYRDIDVVAGWSPEKPDIKSWIVIEAAYGNGFLDRLEHRRRDEIEFSNVDLLNPTNSYTTLVGFNSPKATLSFLPLDHPALPTIAFSFGEAFYTNDPRIGTGTMQGTPVSREHSYQVVLSKMFSGTDFRVTLGHVTTEASLAKIDPDTGLQENEGPGRNKFITMAARRYFGFGLLQASVSKADARDLDTGLPTPEASRLLIDVLER
jgi:hypothetical protein